MYNGKEIDKKLNNVFIISFIILLLISMTGIPYLFFNWQYYITWVKVNSTGNSRNKGITWAI
jgi:flagellar basal body-associated protein FliL